MDHHSDDIPQQLLAAGLIDEASHVNKYDKWQYFLNKLNSNPRIYLICCY